MSAPYSNRLEFLYGRLDYERLGMPVKAAALGPRLGPIRRLLRRLGDPQEAYRIVHIAGTKGKGSTAAMVAAALSAADIPTGLFTSPHLHRLEERFVVDGRPATPEQLVKLVDAIRPEVEAIDRQADRFGERALTFFDITTAMGLLHFAWSSVEAVALEVGMGGRLDSTNAVRPAVSVITTISFDHMRQLGNTLGRIAGEKAGILKRDRPAVVGVRGDEATQAIRAAAFHRRTRIRWIDHDYTYRYDPPGPERRPDPGSVTVETWRRSWGTVRNPAYGEHQARNAATALASLDLLAEVAPELEVGADAVRRGFEHVICPARIEVVDRAPWIVIDGAHNTTSAEALAKTLSNCFPDVPRTLIFGASREKDLVGQLRALVPLCKTVIATRYLENPRAETPEAIADAVRQATGRDARIASGPAEALETARSLSPAEGLICVTGSFFLAAEARALILEAQGRGLSSEPLALDG